MSAPWRAGPRLDDADFAAVRRRAIFEFCKWDPQLEDSCTIARFPLVLSAVAWREITSLAESLAREIRAAEHELCHRPELHADLAIPRRVRRALARPTGRAGRAGAPRLVRFDFHHTLDGWRISEANTDVPGGLNEASGLAALMAAHGGRARPCGDAAGAYAEAVAAALHGGAHVALVHATAYVDDRQVMTYIARRLEERGLRTTLASPANLRWRDGRAALAAGTAIDAIVRFFPAEWLPSLPSRCGWTHFFAGMRTPVSNPATALLTQSKRLPLVWDELRTPMPTWRARLPETRDPRDVSWRSDDAWVMKPVLGRVGEDIGLRGVTDEKDWIKIARSARWHPRHWVAQRRFTPTPLVVDGEVMHPCIGVYTVEGRVVGAYGRVARRPLTDWRARDIAVLVDREPPAAAPERERTA